MKDLTLVIRRRDYYKNEDDFILLCVKYIQLKLWMYSNFEDTIFNLVKVILMKYILLSGRGILCSEDRDKVTNEYYDLFYQKYGDKIFQILKTEE